MITMRAMSGVVGVFFAVSACGQQAPEAEVPPVPVDPGPQAAPPGTQPPRHNAPGHPPANALHATSHSEAPLPQPDPGPAPEAPAAVTEGCPEGMARIEGEDGPFCIHRYEVSVQLVSGQGGHPRAHLHEPHKLKLVSAAGQRPTELTFNESRHLCKASGFHLCTSAEWRDTCDGQPGEGGVTYGTLRGTSYEPGDCNFTHHMSGGMVPLAQTGSYPWCRTPTGVYDLMGNLWEWSDPGLKADNGMPITDKRGGAHYARKISSCAQTAVDTHKANWVGSVGFRCCAEVGG